jgi:hypothetical protein
MASLAKALENGLGGRWRTSMTKKNMILEAKHPFLFSFLLWSWIVGNNILKNVVLGCLSN